MKQSGFFLLIACLLGLPSLGLAKEPTRSFVPRDSAGIHLDSSGTPTRSLLGTFHAEAKPDWLGEASVRELGPVERRSFPRLHRGVRVLDQDLSMMVGEAGLKRAWGRMGPVETVSDFLLDEGQARAAAEAAHEGLSAARSERLWIPVADAYGAAWAVTLQGGPAASRRLWIDAETGEVLFDQDLLQDLHEGSVQVYDQSPLHGDPAILPMGGLPYPEYLFVEGLAVVDSEHRGEILHSSSSEWHYEPQDREFSIAMGYYHLSTIESWFVENTAGELFGGMAYESMAYVNVGTDNFLGEPSLARRAGTMVYELEDGELVHVYLLGSGEGSPLENFAHAAEVWYHEAGHAFTAEAVGTGFDDVPYQSQYGSLNEGLADFGAAMATGDVELLEWVAADSPHAQRPIDELRTHPQDYDPEGDVHENGRIISSLGWTMVGQLGSEDVVPLVNASRYYLTPSAWNFEALMEGILAADEDFGGGRLQIPLMEAMELHGLDPDWVGSQPEALPELVGEASLDEPVTILGEGSDPDGDAVIGRSWRLVEVPEDSAVALSAGQRFDRDLSFTPDVCGVYTVELRVSDSARQLSAPAELSVMPCGAGCQGCAVASDGLPSSVLLLLPLGLILRRRGGRRSASRA